MQTREETALDLCCWPSLLKSTIEGHVRLIACDDVPLQALILELISFF